MSTSNQLKHRLSFEDAITAFDDPFALMAPDPTKRQARDMIATLAGTELPAATLDALVARADGVPLYVEELAKAMAEPGAGRIRRTSRPTCARASWRPRSASHPSCRACWREWRRPM